MIRGTTPTVTLNVDGYTFPDSTVYVYIKQKNVNIKKTGTVIPDANDPSSRCSVTIDLTEEETLSLAKGAAQIQIRAIDINDVIVATPIINFEVNDILNPEILIDDDNSEE